MARPAPARWRRPWANRAYPCDIERHPVPAKGGTQFKPWVWVSACAGTRRIIRATLATILCLAALSPQPAAAQWGGSLTIASQARLRGRPISDHHPVAELEIVRDSRSGFYIGGSAAIVVTDDDGMRPLAFRQYAGIVRPLSSALSIDLGVTHSGYTEYSGVAGGGSYSEAYIGLIGRNLSGRLSLSPGYFHHDDPTVTLEVDGHLDLGPKRSLFAHLGRLTHLRDRPARLQNSSIDWRLGVRQSVGPVDLAAAWTGYVQDSDDYSTAHRHGGALLLSAALAF